jgi:hypothetical protein
MVDGTTFWRLLNHYGLRYEIHFPEHRFYRGDEILHTGNSAHALYNWLQKTYLFHLPAAHEIQMAKALVRQKMEGKIEREYKRQVKKRARAILKDKEEMGSRYPWLKKP